MESSSSSSSSSISFGKSIIVPSVQELVKDSVVVKIPPRYERFDQDSVVVESSSSSSSSSCLLSVPVIDLQKLAATDSMDSELQILHSACRDWGFFQVVNHGVSTNLLEKLKMEIEKFFKLPYEEKKKLWQKEDNHEGFGQLFVVSEDQKLDWSDMFYITTLPYYLRMNHLFNNLPPNLRETLENYISETKRVAMEILDNMAEALKMDIKEMRELYDEGVQSMRMNYYPPCPEPEKAIGFGPHSDADALTILFQLNETQGLQIRKDGNWVSVKPLPYAFVVNIGDVMEIVSNGVYKSSEHRATVNSGKERLSIATFYSPKLDTVLGPAKSLVGHHNPPIFRQVPLDKYFKEFFARKLNGKSFVDFMRV